VLSCLLRFASKAHGKQDTPEPGKMA